MTMLRTFALAGILPLLLAATPASAITTKQKMETCKFGADNQKLAGAKRSQFLKNCMANRNDKRGAAAAGAMTAPKAGGGDKDEQ
jgi:hypothetical protein